MPSLLPTLKTMQRKPILGAHTAKEVLSSREGAPENGTLNPNRRNVWLPLCRLIWVAAAGKKRKKAALLLNVRARARPVQIKWKTIFSFIEFSMAVAVAVGSPSVQTRPKVQIA